MMVSKCLWCVCVCVFGVGVCVRGKLGLGKEGYYIYNAIYRNDDSSYCSTEKIACESDFLQQFKTLLIAGKVHMIIIFRRFLWFCD